ncbi:hypothetical protein H9L39_06849 [Fusarium oxysporum f. sp. albedinis]|nr:hypothetical protein H9L39_06849 [Fusarium oxysporum f. sp. albedinis]
MEVFNADGADHSEQRTLVFGIGVVGHTLIFNITAHPLLRYDGVGLSQNEVHGKAEENGLDSLISKLVCIFLADDLHKMCTIMPPETGLGND